MLNVSTITPKTASTMRPLQKPLFGNASFKPFSEKEIGVTKSAFERVFGVSPQVGVNDLRRAFNAKLQSTSGIIIASTIKAQINQRMGHQIADHRATDLMVHVLDLATDKASFMRAILGVAPLPLSDAITPEQEAAAKKAFVKITGVAFVGNVRAYRDAFEQKLNQIRDLEYRRAVIDGIKDAIEKELTHEISYEMTGKLIDHILQIKPASLNIAIDRGMYNWEL